MTAEELAKKLDYVATAHSYGVVLSYPDLLRDAAALLRTQAEQLAQAERERESLAEMVAEIANKQAAQAERAISLAERAAERLAQAEREKQWLAREVSYRQASPAVARGQNPAVHTPEYWLARAAEQAQAEKEEAR